MRKKIIISSVIACAILLLIAYFNSYSIVLWENGFNNDDVYQQESLNNNSKLSYFVLLADDNRYGILCMKKDGFGIWHKDNSNVSLIFAKNSTITNKASVFFEHYNLPFSLTCTDLFFVGLISEKESEKIYSMKQQPGCLFSADLYQLANSQYLVFFHVTSYSPNDINKTNDYIQKSVHFEKMK